jgi:predicted dehydrogenase
MTSNLSLTLKNLNNRRLDARNNGSVRFTIAQQFRFQTLYRLAKEIIKNEDCPHSLHKY